MKERLASCISGSGSTMEAIVLAIHSGRIPIDLGCVISSDPNAPGIEKALRLGVPQKDVIVVNPEDYRISATGKVDYKLFGLKLLEELKAHGVTVVTMNGWMPYMPKLVVRRFANRIFNQHPGPIPEFGGQGMEGKVVHAAVLEFTRLTGREMWTEVVAQRTTETIDGGVVVKSARVPILPGDTPDLLNERAISVEYEVQIALLQDVADNCVAVLPPRESLVKPGQEHFLKQAKEYAINLYSHN